MFLPFKNLSKEIQELDRPFTEQYLIDNKFAKVIKDFKTKTNQVKTGGSKTRFSKNLKQNF